MQAKSKPEEPLGVNCIAFLWHLGQGDFSSFIKKKVSLSLERFILFTSEFIPLLYHLNGINQ
jgi:hypothetical protein